jgi:hypothetical protein
MSWDGLVAVIISSSSSSRSYCRLGGVYTVKVWRGFYYELL